MTEPTMPIRLSKNPRLNRAGIPVISRRTYRITRPCFVGLHPVSGNPMYRLVQVIAKSERD